MRQVRENTDGEALRREKMYVATHDSSDPGYCYHFRRRPRVKLVMIAVLIMVLVLIARSSRRGEK